MLIFLSVFESIIYLIKHISIEIFDIFVCILLLDHIVFAQSVNMHILNLFKLFFFIDFPLGIVKHLTHLWWAHHCKHGLEVNRSMFYFSSEDLDLFLTLGNLFDQWFDNIILLCFDDVRSFI